MNVKRQRLLRIFVAVVGALYVLAGSVATIAGAVMVRLATPAAHTAQRQEEFGAAMVFRSMGIAVFVLGIFSWLMAVGCLFLFRKVRRTSQVGAGGIVFLIGATAAALGLLALLCRIYI